MRLAEINSRAASSLLEKVIQEATHNLLETQAESGAWVDRFDTGVMSDAQTLISLHLLGVRDPDWTQVLIKRIETLQETNGAWEVYPGDGGDLSATVECYYALELYQKWNEGPQRKDAAKSFILSRGGLKYCRNLTKVFLAAGGEIPWSWLPNPRIYSWMFSKYSPVHIWDLVMFTRLHIPSMLVLSSVRYRSETVKKPVLRELFVKRKLIDHNWLHKYRYQQEKYHHELSQKRRARLRRCLESLLNDREGDGTLAGYHSATFLLLLTLRTLGVAITSPEITEPLKALKRNIDMNQVTGDTHQQTCDAHVWNTSIALQALQQSGYSPGMNIQSGIHYLLSKQQSKVGQWIMKSSVPPGGWGFSSNNDIHADTDDTVSVLEALYAVRQDHEETWWKGVHWLLAMQNNDGGWSAFERNSNKRWVEWLPANDMKRSMIDPSTPDITGRVLEFLIRRHIVPKDSRLVVRGVDWLISHQEPDGSWYGRWGNTYLYGTWCAIRALTAAEVPSNDVAMKRAKRWIRSVQRSDGGFGESCESSIKGEYRASIASVSTQTAWGLDTLLQLFKNEESQKCQDELQDCAEQAVHWLLENGGAGRWTEEIPTGAAFPGSLHIRYEIYPKVWPLLALCHYRDVLGTEGR